MNLLWWCHGAPQVIVAWVKTLESPVAICSWDGRTARSRGLPRQAASTTRIDAARCIADVYDDPWHSASPEVRLGEVIHEKRDCEVCLGASRR